MYQNRILMIAKNAFFENELDSVIKEYPCFKKRNGKDILYLKGILDIPNEEGLIVGNFAVEIYPTADFPYRFPLLFEVGGDIPCEADWHKYYNNLCCLTVEAKEILLCKHGMTLSTFIKDIAIPYFANQLYRKKEGYYLNEYSHGIKGIYEFYSDLFHTDDTKFWGLCIEYMLGKRKYDRNKACYCGSAKKYKKCHLLVEDKVRAIGSTQITKDFKKLNLV